MNWPSSRAPRVLGALLRIGWSIKRQTGSHRTLQRTNWPDYVFSFHDSEEIGPRMLARILAPAISECDPANLFSTLRAVAVAGEPVER